jgi:DNA-binding winged helix-turn-helix (wHTH) protein/tetratricopeptide (TPR) repeat protein
LNQAHTPKPPGGWAQIGQARFDVARRRLTLDGAVVALDHRPAELLMLLLSRAGQTVPKNEILDHLWPDRAVTEASLTKCVRQLRLALRDHDHDLVRTVHGQGFRIEASGVPEWGSEPSPVPPAPPPPAAQHRRTGVPIAAAILVLGAAVALWRHSPAMQAAHAPPQAARQAYIKGMQDWAQRTPASLTAAVDDFTTALRIDPDYAEAYVGLANTYNLLREYTGMPDAQAFALAKGAAQHALRLNPNLAGAHAALAFVLFWGDWDFPAALAEYERGLALEPDNPGIHHWYATSLDNVGDRTRALAHIDRALELSPESRSIRADRAILLFHLGRTEEARAILAGLAAIDPEFASPHAYLAEIGLATGDDAGFLREAARFAQLTHRAAPAAIAAAAASGEASGGHAGMIHGLLSARLAAFQTGTVGAADVASAYALSGDKPAALRMLGQAIDRHELTATFVLNDPGLRLLAADPAGAPLLARLRLDPGQH